MRSRTSALSSPFGVLEEHQVGGLRDDDAAVVELEPGRVLEPAGELLHGVRLAVAVGVLEDQELVVVGFARLPVRVARPHRDPQPALRVPRHLHRLRQLREHLLAGEQRHLQPLPDGHLLDGLFAAEEQVGAVRARARLVRHHRHELRQVAVIDLRVPALRDRPDDLVAVGGHHVERFQLLLDDLVVALPVRELEPRAAAVGAVPVGDAVPLVPVEVLVLHRGAELLQQRGAVRPGRVAEQRRLDPVGEELVPLVVQVDAVDGERGLGGRVHLPGGGEQVDAPDAVGRRDLGHRLRVQPQVLVDRRDRGPGRQVGRLVVLERDRREQHQPRGRLPVVLLRERVLDERVEVGFELRQAGLAGPRLVVPEEGEDHVGVGAGLLEPVRVHHALVGDQVRLRHRGLRAEPLVRRAEVLVPQPDGQLVRGVPEVADGEVEVGVAGVEQGFEPPVVLHAVGERVADDADVVALLQLERGDGRRVRGGRGRGLGGLEQREQRRGRPQQEADGEERAADRHIRTPESA
jgi:hypothetical protein